MKLLFGSTGCLLWLAHPLTLEFFSNLEGQNCLNYEEKLKLPKCNFTWSGTLS